MCNEGVYLVGVLFSDDAGDPVGEQLRRVCARVSRGNLLPVSQVEGAARLVVRGDGATTLVAEVVLTSCQVALATRT